MDLLRVVYVPQNLIFSKTNAQHLDVVKKWAREWMRKKHVSSDLMISNGKGAVGVWMQIMWIFRSFFCCHKINANCYNSPICPFSDCSTGSEKDIWRHDFLSFGRGWKGMIIPQGVSLYNAPWGHYAYISLKCQQKRFQTGNALWANGRKTRLGVDHSVPIRYRTTLPPPPYVLPSPSC